MEAGSVSESMELMIFSLIRKHLAREYLKCRDMNNIAYRWKGRSVAGGGEYPLLVRQWPGKQLL